MRAIQVYLPNKKYLVINKLEEDGYFTDLPPDEYATDILDYLSISDILDQITNYLKKQV